MYVVCAMIEVPSHQSILTEVSIWSQASPLVICDGKSVSDYMGLMMSVSFYLFSTLSTISIAK
jgi:hypothetical protein